MIVLFPSYARQVSGGRKWRVTVAGMAVRPLPSTSRRRTMAVAVLKRVLALEEHQCASPVFQQRSDAFLFQRLGGRRIRGTVGDVAFDGGQTDRTGHFSTTVEIEASRLSAAAGAVCPWVGTSAWLDDEDESDGAVNAGGATGVVQLVTERGLSVISDIDDTVKVTNVANRRELLANTFVRAFVPVPGMDAVFRRWQEEASAFHYVSASPWQLSECLAGFLRAEGLPAGSLHLKLFRLKDSTPLGRFPSRKRSKRRAIEQIMADFPARRFLLVGDSGERDPEVYAAIARRQPDRVTGVLIRLVAGPHLPSPKRFARLERRLPPGLIRFFTAADELTGPGPVGGTTDSALP
ncbi:MAG: DUF2183 domain-containing protein [Planctomycetia bacterium]|nr:DUF2183 domain-containing protein [Planctomycetia bacterium]